MAKVSKQNLNKKEIVEEEKLPVKEFILVVGVITVVFLAIYFLTVGAGKLGWFDTHYTKSPVEEAVISYENIEVGTMLNRQENDYYVVLADMSKNSMYISSVISMYKEKENVIPLYIVDLSEGLNRSVVSDTTVLSVKDISNLKVSDTSLVRVTNKTITETYTGVDNIEKVLK